MNNQQQEYSKAQRILLTNADLLISRFIYSRVSFFVPKLKQRALQWQKEYQQLIYGIVMQNASASLQECAVAAKYAGESFQTVADVMRSAGHKHVFDSKYGVRGHYLVCVCGMEYNTSPYKQWTDGVDWDWHRHLNCRSITSNANVPVDRTFESTTAQLYFNDPYNQ